MDIIQFLKENKQDVICCDRIDNIVSVYLKDDVRIEFRFHTINKAIRKQTMLRKELEGIGI